MLRVICLKTSTWKSDKFGGASAIAACVIAACVIAAGFITNTALLAWVNSWLALVPNVSEGYEKGHANNVVDCVINIEHPLSRYFFRLRALHENCVAISKSQQRIVFDGVPHFVGIFRLSPFDEKPGDGHFVFREQSRCLVGVEDRNAASQYFFYDLLLARFKVCLRSGFKFVWFVWPTRGLVGGFRRFDEAKLEPPVRKP
jgi:hypothetical protein